jgi:YHS domain-containing protein
VPARRTLLALLAATPVLLAMRTAAAAERPVYTGWFSDLAVSGHDPVAYFREGRPVVGQRTFEHKWNGATWRFASAENRDAFAAAPERYAPAYGGYCAWAVAQGYTASGDPKHWTIVDGRLYLNYDAEVNARWKADVPGFIASGDRNWPRIIGK